MQHSLDQISDYEVREFLESKFRDYVDLSKKPTVERSPVWSELRKKVVSIVENLPIISDTVRKEIDMWDNTFISPGDKPISEEELRVREEELNKVKAEWLKKAKKKKWEKEDEKNLIAQYSATVNERMKA